MEIYDTRPESKKETSASWLLNTISKYYLVNKVGEGQYFVRKYTKYTIRSLKVNWRHQLPGFSIRYLNTILLIKSWRDNASLFNFFL